MASKIRGNGKNKFGFALSNVPNLTLLTGFAADCVSRNVPNFTGFQHV